MDMLHLDHMAAATFAPVSAYLLSAVGCAVGLECTRRARRSRHRLGWLLPAALALGGIGILLAHLVAHPNRAVHDAALADGFPHTVIGAVLVLGLVGIGLWPVTAPEPGPIALLTGELVTGPAIGTVYWSTASGLPGSIAADPIGFGLSLTIAVGAGIVSLWCALRFRSGLATAAAALVLAAGVVSVHYIEMFAMDSRLPAAVAAAAQTVPGPLLGALGVVVLGLLLGIGMTVPAPRRGGAPAPHR